MNKQQKRLLIATLGSLDNDHRIRKTIKCLSEKFIVIALSNKTTQTFNFANIDIGHTNQRYKNIPGTNKLFHWLKILKAAVKINYSEFDVIHCNDIETLPIGYIAKKVNNKIKIVYDAHEYETETKGLHGLKKLFVKLLERYLIRYADGVITVSEGIADEYVKLYGIKKPTLVLNTPPYQHIVKKNIFRETLGIQTNQTIFLYQGGLSAGRGIEILLETFIQENDLNHVIVFMGDGPLQSLIEEYAFIHSNIFYHPAVVHEILLDYTSSADVGILFYENNCLNHYYCSPNKMFEYLMAELPVIVSNLYEMKKLVEKNNIGVVAKENTVNGLQSAINQITSKNHAVLLENIKRMKQSYNWENQEKELIRLYTSLNE